MKKLIYRFFENCGVRKVNNKYIYYNCNSGDWYSINKCEHDIISIIMEGNNTFESYRKNFKNDEEYRYIKIIFDNLMYLQIILKNQEKISKEKKMIIYEITQRCNLQCTHCCNYVDKDDIIDLDYNDILDHIDKIIKWNPKSISITGGEPLIRKDIDNILKYLRNNYNGNIMLSSNGLLINKYIEVILKCVDQLDLSLDGVDEESCAEIRGKGTFKKVINNINLLKTCGFEKISLSFTCSNSNMHLVSEFKKLCHDLKVKPIVRGFQPIGKGYLNKNKFNKFTSLEKKNTNHIFEKNLKVTSCLAGLDTLFIKNDGNIYPCPTITKKENILGNLNSIEKIEDLNFTEYLYEKILDNHKLKKCKNCCINIFCITCPGIINLEMKDDLFDLDYRCKTIGESILQKI